MPSLYEEALVEIKKLKQIAEDDAKNAIIQEITPVIRKFIATELAGKSNVLFKEQEDPTLSDPGVGDDDAPIDPAGIAPEPAPVVDAPSITGGPGDAPIKVGGHELNMPMPSADGKLVVDFDDLFVPAEPGEGDADAALAPGSVDSLATAPSTTPPEMPGGMPDPTPVDVNPSGSADQAATPPAPIAVDGETGEAAAAQVAAENFELFAEELDATAKTVHKAYSSKIGVPLIMKEALQGQLFQLLETLETMSSKNLVSKQLKQIWENRLEILHAKLKETVIGNTYYRTQEGTEMASKSLKEMAAKMILESETIEGGPITSPADVHKTEKSMKVDNAEEAAADKAGAHAQKVTEPTVTLKTEAAELAKLEEELSAIITENPGDSLVAEPGGQQNLAGAASSIPDKMVPGVDPTKTPANGPTNLASHVQGVAENMEHSKDTGSEQEVGKSSTGHPVKETIAVGKKALAEQTKKIKAEAYRKQIAALQEKIRKECGMEIDEAPLPALEAGDLSVMGEDDTVINFNFDLSDLVPELGQLGDEDEIEITDDDDDDLSGLDALGDEEPGAGESPLGGGSTREEEEEEELAGPLAEQVRRGRGPVARKALQENKNLKAELNAQQLLNAKIVHLQPFVSNRNLTKEQKHKIVEHLDRGKTVEEVKSIFGKLKTVLENMQRKAREKAGSSSKAGTSSGVNLNENVNQYEGAQLVAEERNRLMELAGIKRK